MSATVKRGGTLYGRQQLEAVMYALFQRMRRQCTANRTNAFVFFDQGHAEYRRLYRMAQVYLPTGSSLGGWAGGPTRNLPLDMFIKDGNEKNSKLCYFTQAADLIAYAAFIKIKGEDGRLSPWQQANALDKLYDSIPKNQVNLLVQKKLEPRRYRTTINRDGLPEGRPLRRLIHKLRACFMNRDSNVAVIAKKFNCQVAKLVYAEHTEAIRHLTPKFST